MFKSEVIKRIDGVEAQLFEEWGETGRKHIRRAATILEEIGFLRDPSLVLAALAQLALDRARDEWEEGYSEQIGRARAMVQASVAIEEQLEEIRKVLRDD